MRLSSEQLDTFIEDPQFRRLPVLLAVEQPFTHWGEASRLITQQAAKTSCWTILHKVAQLFDAYPDTLSSLKLNYSNGHDDCPWLDADFRINGTYAKQLFVLNEWRKISQDFPEFKAQDEGKALDTVLDWIRSAGLGENGGYEMVSELRFFQTVFSQPITSAKQARQLARETAPDIDAWVRKQLLDQVLDQDAPEVAEAQTPRM